MHAPNARVTASSTMVLRRANRRNNASSVGISLPARPRGKPLAMKVNAVLWYLSGLSMNRIAFLLQVSAQAVLTWIRDCAKDYYEKPEPTGRTIVLQLDEMWHYLKA